MPILPQLRLQPPTSIQFVIDRSLPQDQKNRLIALAGVSPSKLTYGACRDVTQQLNQKYLDGSFLRQEIILYDIVVLRYFYKLVLFGRIINLTVVLRHFLRGSYVPNGIVIHSLELLSKYFKEGNQLNMVIITLNLIYQQPKTIKDLLNPPRVNQSVLYKFQYSFLQNVKHWKHIIDYEHFKDRSSFQLSHKITNERINTLWKLPLLIYHLQYIVRVKMIVTT